MAIKAAKITPINMGMWGSILNFKMLTHIMKTRPKKTVRASHSFAFLGAFVAFIATILLV